MRVVLVLGCWWRYCEGGVGAGGGTYYRMVLIVGAGVLG